MQTDSRPLIRFFNTHEPVTTFYTDLIPILLAAGFNVEVMQSRSEYRARGTSLDKLQDQPGFRLVQIFSGIKRASNLWRKAWAAVTYVIGAATCSLFRQRAVLNVFLTQPPLFSIWGVVLRKLKREPYVCVVMDIYPDCAIEMGKLDGASLVARVTRRMCRAIWHRSSGVIVIGRCMQAFVTDSGIPPDRIHMIPNWVNEQLVRPVEHADNPLRRELGLFRDFVVLYSGNLGRAHYFEGILDAARALRDVPGLKFVFIGDGARRKEIEAVRDKEGLDHIIFLPAQAESRLQYSLSLGDIHFISLLNRFCGLVVPSKTYGAMAAGRPVIYQGNELGEIAQMINENDIGAVVAQDDHERLVALIREYHDSRELVSRQGRNVRQLVEKKYSAAVASKRYADLLQQIIAAELMS